MDTFDKKVVSMWLIICMYCRLAQESQCGRESLPVYRQVVTVDLSEDWSGISHTRGYLHGVRWDGIKYLFSQFMVRSQRLLATHG